MLLASGMSARHGISPSIQLQGNSAGILKPICKSTRVFLLSQTTLNNLFGGKSSDISAFLKMLLLIRHQSCFP